MVVPDISSPDILSSRHLNSAISNKHVFGLEHGSVTDDCQRPAAMQSPRNFWLQLAVQYCSSAGIFLNFTALGALDVGQKPRFRPALQKDRRNFGRLPNGFETKRACPTRNTLLLTRDACSLASGEAPPGSGEGRRLGWHGSWSDFW